MTNKRQYVDSAYVVLVWPDRPNNFVVQDKALNVENSFMAWPTHDVYTLYRTLRDRILKASHVRLEY